MGGGGGESWETRESKCRGKLSKLGNVCVSVCVCVCVCWGEWEKSWEKLGEEEG